MSGSGAVKLVLAIVIVVFGGVAWSNYQDHTKRTHEAHAKRAAMHAQDTSGDRLALEACAIAQEAVKAKLKSPTSAKFPGCALGAHEYRIRADEARDTVWVMGHVDAQNDFGAMLRSDFGVKLERVGGELVPVQTVLEH